jgi:hypothetical protein
MPTTVIWAFYDDEPAETETKTDFRAAGHCRAVELSGLWLGQRQAGRKGTIMELHEDTFEYLEPSDDQVDTMKKARQLSKEYAEQLAAVLPDGPDKTYIMRRIREIAMWVNVAITREADGSPRIEI